MQAIGRNNSAEFYPCHYVVKTVFEGMILTATYTLLQQQAGLKVGHSTLCLLSLPNTLPLGHIMNYMMTESFHKTLKRAEPELFTSTNGIQKAIFDKFECYKQDPNYVAGSSTHKVPNVNRDLGKGDDQLLGNMVLFMRDAFIYLEMALAIPEGDIGQVFEVIK
ncbi:hypothetical protein FRC11_015091, partial [Ceratobasidium sp. 423]